MKNLLPALVVGAALYLLWINGYDVAALAYVAQVHFPSLIAGVVLGVLVSSAL